jgi:hypothetical protein
MGRIYKRFTVENPRTRGKARAMAKIDSGADVTLVRREVGEQIGVDIDNDEPIAIGGIGGRVLGFEVPAKVTIGRSSARLKVAVPIGRYDAKTRKITAVDQKENLIGHDFLQATQAKIDFTREIDDAFVEGETRVDDVVRLKITPAEASALREWVRQRGERGGRRHHSTKKTAAQLDREIAEAVAKARLRKASR